MIEFIRVWKEFDVGEVGKHLLIVGDIKGDCSSCRHLGIDYSHAKTCPGCGVEFKYIATRTRDTRRIRGGHEQVRCIIYINYNPRHSRSLCKFPA